MKTKLLLTLLWGASVLGASAQGFFDDRKFDKPVPHISVYSNENYSLKSITRNAVVTCVTLRYRHRPTDRSRVSINLNDILTDRATGKRYPVMYSLGIPKEPENYTFGEENDTVMDIHLMFPPLPESVRSVDLSFGLSEIQLGRVPVQLGEAKLWFPAGADNGKGDFEGLSIHSVADNGEATFVSFIYAPGGYGSVYLNPKCCLRDPATGKRYPAEQVAGISTDPGRGQRGLMSFIVRFPSIAKDGVRKFDFVESPASRWNISGVTLE